ncbi:MAG: TRAP transporter small permease subunit [Gammaproteobacteria bacterium]|nr:TRAP transporter small permease subunit [Gammaproteobacteria bacterium]
MLNRIDTLVNRLISAFVVLGIVALIMMMGLTFLDVVGRTLFGRALTGTVESITLLMGILVFSGLAYTETLNKHVVVDVVQTLFSPPLKRFSQVLNLILGTFITAIMTWRLTLSAIVIFEDGETTMIWALPYWPVAIVMVIGLVLFLLVLLIKTIQSFVALAASEKV